MNKIKNLPLLERPYEKLKYLGSDSLSNSELLSIIIKTGIKNLNSIQISQIIFSKFENGNNFNFLQGNLLKKCNISEDMIEKRYYSELLKQKRG